MAHANAMRSAPAWSLLALLTGCATAPPAPISEQQARTFRETVVTAERAIIIGNNPAAEVALRNAKSDFYYAEHSPMNPERARSMATQAQAEAELAVSLSRSQDAATLTAVVTPAAVAADSR
jgi:hypothetical protein